MKPDARANPPSRGECWRLKTMTGLHASVMGTPVEQGSGRPMVVYRWRGKRKEYVEPLESFIRGPGSFEPCPEHGAKDRMRRYRRQMKNAT
jgi:hypothetical protein